MCFCFKRWISTTLYCCINQKGCKYLFPAPLPYGRSDKSRRICAVRCSSKRRYRPNPQDENFAFSYNPYDKPPTMLQRCLRLLVFSNIHFSAVHATLKSAPPADRAK